MNEIQLLYANAHMDSATKHTDTNPNRYYSITHWDKMLQDSKTVKAVHELSMLLHKHHLYDENWQWKEIDEQNEIIVVSLRR